MSGFAEGNLLFFSHALKREVEMIGPQLNGEVEMRLGWDAPRPIEYVNIEKRQYYQLLKIQRMIEAFDAADLSQKWRDVK